MKKHELEMKINKLKEIAINTNPLLKWDEVETSREAAVVNSECLSTKGILLQKKEIEERIKEADKKLDELMTSTLEVYNNSGMSASTHIKMFASSVAKLNEVATELEKLINVQRPELNKIIFEEEIEKKEELIPIWNDIKDCFDLDSVAIEENVPEAEIVEETATDAVTVTDEEMAELKKFITASMQNTRDEEIASLEPVSHSKKKKSLFKFNKKRA